MKDYSSIALLSCLFQSVRVSIASVEYIRRERTFVVVLK